MKQKLHFSGLNGLRAIAALGVLFSHITLALDLFGLNPHIFGTNADGNPRSTSLAGFGVSIFFALSGFLITYLLLEEKKTQEINIKNFYIRRVLRIWPLYYLYLLLCVLTLLIFDLPFEKSSLFFYVFLTANIPFIIGKVIPFIGHYWSLGVEEQFYSFWPWVVRKSKSPLRITIILCVLLLFLTIALRLIDIFFFNGKENYPYQVIHVTRFHCMLIGAIAANLYFQKQAMFLRITNHKFPQFLAWMVILLVAVNKFHIASFLDNEFISVVAVFLIIGQIEKTNRIINLENRFFDFIGKISYGIYVIHPLIIFYLSRAFHFSDNKLTSYLIVYVSSVVATLIFAYLSYEFFEKKFLLLKNKYTTIHSVPSYDDSKAEDRDSSPAPVFHKN